MADDRGQRTDDRSQRAEDRGLRSEVCVQILKGLRVGRPGW
jgi:hypothetical protein